MYLSNNMQEFTPKLSDYNVTKLIDDQDNDPHDYSKHNESSDYYPGCCKLLNLSLTPSFPFIHYNKYCFWRRVTFNDDMHHR